MQERPTRRGDPPPTVRQVFVIAAALCERIGEPFPDRQDNMSDLVAARFGGANRPLSLLFRLGSLDRLYLPKPVRLVARRSAE